MCLQNAFPFPRAPSECSSFQMICTFRSTRVPSRKSMCSAAVFEILRGGFLGGTAFLVAFCSRKFSARPPIFHSDKFRHHTWIARFSYSASFVYGSPIDSTFSSFCEAFAYFVPKKCSKIEISAVQYHLFPTQCLDLPPALCWFDLFDGSLISRVCFNFVIRVMSWFFSTSCVWLVWPLQWVGIRVT